MIFVLIIVATIALLVARYMEWLPGFDHVSPNTIIAFGGFLMLGAMLYRHQADARSKYDVLDIFMDSRTQKASLEAHLTIAMAGLAGWWITSPDADVEKGASIVQILMIFIVYRGAKQFADAWRDKPNNPPADQNIRQQVLVSPDAPESPDLPAKPALVAPASPPRRPSGKRA